MSGMNIRLATNQRGALNVLAIPLIMSVVLLLGALGFGAWAFTERQEYKNNTEEKVDSAVAVAVQQAKSEKDNEFLEREKEPLKTYTSASQYGNFTFQYPKTWSGYSHEQGEELTLTFQSDIVSSEPSTPYALKIEVINRKYDIVVARSDNNIKQGKLSASAIKLPKVPDVLGLRLDGQIENDKTGAVVFMPLRDKTLKISTESPDKVSEFNKYILPNFEFDP